MAFPERARIWRDHASVLREYGQDALANVLEKLAGELESDALASTQRVTLDEAVHLSGFSRGHLRRLVRDGKLPNIGSKKKPEFFLADLPRKPGYNPDNERLASESEPAQISTHKQVARAVVQGG